ncbi:MAG: energy transducer TonB [Betaproteobacteria bacterium]
MRFAYIAPSLLTLLVLSRGAFGEVPVYTSTAITEEMLFADDPNGWARPKVVVPPDFPVDQLTANASGHVDAEFGFDQKGSVKQVRIVKSEPQNPAFERAVLDVAKLWLFSAVLNKDCVPVDSTGNVRIWFEIRDGKGVVSVSGNVRPASAANDSLPRKMEWANRAVILGAVRYPNSARRDGVQADLLVAVRVEAASGNATDSVVTWMEVSSGATATVAESFKTAVLKSLRFAKFKPKDGNNYRVCIPYSFRLR